MNPKFNILTKEQKQVWPELNCVGDEFVLYGGTAISLQLGHRQSRDLDFFSNNCFQPGELKQTLPFAKGSDNLQFKENTLTISLAEPNQTKLSFFGGLKLSRVGQPIKLDNGVTVASLDDLFATKLNTVYQRSQAKDYIDIYHIMRTGISLEKGLANAAAVFGNEFNPILPLKALCYYKDGDLDTIPQHIKSYLTEEAIKITKISEVNITSRQITTTAMDAISKLEIKATNTMDKLDIKAWLDSMGVRGYIINDDLTVDVNGNVHLDNKELTLIPIQFGKVRKSFNCSNNPLTSLKGCPNQVGDFFCQYTDIKNLNYCPIYVDGDFFCHGTKLEEIGHCTSETLEMLKRKYEVNEDALGGKDFKALLDAAFYKLKVKESEDKLVKPDKKENQILDDVDLQ